MIVQAARGAPRKSASPSAPLLDHRAPRAVEDQDALAHEAREQGGAIGLHGGIGRGCNGVRQTHKF